MSTKPKKYGFPECLNGQCRPPEYEKWLERKARSLVKRDRKGGNSSATRQGYKMAIHEAVVRSKGIDEYTGKQLRWDLISRYNNDESKAGKTEYKKTFGDLPTVDHCNEGMASPLFRLCSWRVNDAKNDLTLEEFLALCREVLDHHR